MRRFLLVTGISLLLFSCALPRASSLKPQDFAGEIQKYRTMTGSTKDPSAQARAHYRLALLYSHHDNPSPDYPQALRELETFIALDPQKSNTDEVKDRLALLQELERASGENRKLRNSVEQLTKENKEMKSALEKMERLDMKIEEKRRKQLR